MGAPTQPTATLIVTEALNKYGIKSPTPAQITRASDYGLELTKDLIWMKGKRWKSLLAETYLKIVANQTIINLPADFEDFKTITVMDGLIRGAVTGSPTTTSIPLTSLDGTPSSANYGNRMIISYQGADSTLTSGQGTTLTAYAAPNATVSPALSSAPASGDTVLISDRQYPANIKWVGEYDEMFYPSVIAYPTEFYHQPGTTVGTLLLNRIPDKVYYARLRYYISLQMLDTSGTRYSTILRRWKPVFVQGVYVWLLEDNSDDRFNAQMQKLGDMLKILVGREVDGVNQSDMQRTVED